MSVIVAPSILTADMGRLADQVRAAVDGGAEYIHLDVMDGKFVPVITFGPLVVQAVRKAVGVTLDMMILHGQAVMRASEHAMVVVDMPFGSYEAAPEQAFANATRVLKETGAQAVKVEAGPSIAATIAFLASEGAGYITGQNIRVDGGLMRSV